MVLFSVTLSDRDDPKPPHFDIFALHIFAAGGDRDFKLGRQVVHS